ncbi:conserved Plasmodium protein, unknown function [Plasmodium ovale curtisi]|uniref:Uncharacterized protein n=1 Tax=Plasmodium ovale curtisi TaxID=864141 RepID=A0A1A8W048_PLAOA|nr:conserved Plasmodium protein, unknown function [Plasmodium ovale curtisi]
MPKFNFFPKVNFLAYIKRIKIKYNPCASYNDNCRKLIHLIEAKQRKDKFLNLEYKLELIELYEKIILNAESNAIREFVSLLMLYRCIASMCYARPYNEEPLIEIEMQNSKLFKFNPENHDLSEIQRVIDEDQHMLHQQFMKTNLLENNENSFLN